MTQNYIWSTKTWVFTARCTRCIHVGPQKLNYQRHHCNKVRNTYKTFKHEERKTQSYSSLSHLAMNSLLFMLQIKVTGCKLKSLKLSLSWFGYHTIYSSVICKALCIEHCNIVVLFWLHCICVVSWPTRIYWHVIIKTHNLDPVLIMLCFLQCLTLLFTGETKRECLSLCLSVCLSLSLLTGRKTPTLSLSQKECWPPFFSKTYPCQDVCSTSGRPDDI